MAAPRREIRIALHSEVTGTDQTDPAEIILQKIQKVRESVTQLRADTAEAEHVRDQFIIHFQQCQEDNNTLQRIYKKLKLDLATQASQAEASAASQAAQQAQAADSRSSFPASRRLATYENIRLTPVVEPHGSYPESAVRLRYAVNTSSVICTVQFSPDGSKIAFADGNFAYIIQAADGEVLSTIALDPPPDPSQAHTRALKFSPNGALLALSGSRNDVLLYDVETQKLVQTYEGHQKEVSARVFNGDGSWLVSGGFDGQVLVWDTRTHRQVKRLSHTHGSTDGTIVDIATTPDIPFYAVGFMSGSLGIYNGEFEQPMMTFTAHQQILMGLAVSPHDDTIATVSRDQTVKVWRMRALAACQHTLTGHLGFVLSVAFAPKSDIMITASKDQTIRIWQYKTGQPLFTITAHKNTLFEIDHHPTQRVFVSSSGDGVVCVWDYDELA